MPYSRYRRKGKWAAWTNSVLETPPRGGTARPAKGGISATPTLMTAVQPPHDDDKQGQGQIAGASWAFAQRVMWTSLGLPHGMLPIRTHAQTDKPTSTRVWPATIPTGAKSPVLHWPVRAISLSPSAGAASRCHRGAGSVPQAHRGLGNHLGGGAETGSRSPSRPRAGCGLRVSVPRTAILVSCPSRPHARGLLLGLGPLSEPSDLSPATALAMASPFSPGPVTSISSYTKSVAVGVLEQQVERCTLRVLMAAITNGATTPHRPGLRPPWACGLSGWRGPQTRA